jgi:hypothetical protein
MAQVVKCLLCKLKALGSNSGTTKMEEGREIKKNPTKWKGQSKIFFKDDMIV